MPLAHLKINFSSKSALNSDLQSGNWNYLEEFLGEICKWAVINIFDMKKINEEPYQTCFKCQFPQLKQSVFAKGDTYFGSFIAYLLPILVSCRFLSLWFALGRRAVFGAFVCSVFTISCELFVFEEEGSLKQNSCNFRIVLFCKASSSILLTFFDLREN